MFFYKAAINKYNWEHAIHYTVYKKGNADSIEILSEGTQLKPKYHTKKQWESYKDRMKKKGFLFSEKKKQEDS